MMADSDFLIPYVDDLFMAFRELERFEEPGMVSATGATVRWGWGNWLDTPPPDIFLNGSIMNPAAYVVNYVTGIVTFDPALDPGDDVRANYQIRMFPTSIYLTFLETALSSINAIKPQTHYDFSNFPQNWYRGIVLLAYRSTCQMLIPKMATFRYRRLFEDPDRIMTELRANSQEVAAEFTELKPSLKRRGETMPAAIADFNRGKMPWKVDESNFSNYAVIR